MDRTNEIIEALSLAIGHTARGNRAAAIGCVSLALAHMALGLTGDNETPVGDVDGTEEPTLIWGRPIRDYTSPIPIVNYDTVLGFLAKNAPHLLELIDDPAYHPEATARDGWWLTHQYRRRFDADPPKTKAPKVLQEVGIHEVNMYPVPLLMERFQVGTPRAA